jgi:anti-sigma B factor antagonist
VSDERPSELSLDVQRNGVAATVRVSGELNVSTAQDLTSTCQALHADGAREVVIDLTNTNFVDSAGLGALVTAHQLFGDDDGRLRLAHPNELLVRLLDLTGLAGFLLDG